MVVAEFGTGQVFWSVLWITLFVIWIWLLIAIFGDILRSPDLSGWGKALWSIFIIFVPYLGVFVYLIARGGKMREHAMADAQARDQAMRAYVRDVAASDDTSAVDQLARLAELRAQGVITDEEFQQLKARTIA